MSRWLPFVCLFCWLVPSAFADSITIGQLQYLGTEDGVSAYKVTLNTAGITSGSLSLSSVILSVKGVSQQAGPLLSPTVLLFTGGPGRILPACPCSSIMLQLVFSSSEPQITLVLADGTTFTTHSTLKLSLHSLNGKRLNAGDFIPIQLVAVPEPGTLLLIGTGLLFTGKKFASRRHRTS